jgi:hypothetical protein
MSGGLMAVGAAAVEEFRTAGRVPIVVIHRDEEEHRDASALAIRSQAGPRLVPERIEANSVLDAAHGVDRALRISDPGISTCSSFRFLRISGVS